MSAVRKVIVVGLDGLEPSIVEPMIEAGALPNLHRLRNAGGYARLGTTLPAQTPVAWSTFATGANPGAHGIFDFVGRDPRTYRPDLALNRYEQSNPFLPPRVVNLRRGATLWDRLTAAGIPSIVLRCPCTYPPDRLKGRLLSGMGVPDLRGGFGSPTFYTTDAGAVARESEQVIHLSKVESGPIETVINGPRNPKDGSDVQARIRLEARPDSGVMILHSEGRPRVLELRPGVWSDWLQTRFKLGMLQSAKGIVRFLLLRMDEDGIELYASPVNFDPNAPLFPISHPDLYAADLADALDAPYYTTGMVEDHTGLNNERIDERMFLNQCDLVWREREAMWTHELNRLDSGLLYCLFDTPDRVQHLFWRYREPDHPFWKGRTRRHDYAEAIPETYRRADAMVGHALEAASDETLVIALSDHGFGGFRRGVDLNRWLLEQGLLALDTTSDAPEAAIDWSKTQAYAVGLTGLYLNIQGRERDGVVPAEEAEPLRQRIAEALRSVHDDGASVIRAAASRRGVYHGPFVEEAPDVVVAYNAGYRTSWGSSLGAVGRTVFEDNIKKWSGDHIIDPNLVPGVLFMNRPFRTDQARLIDLAPTILEALGAPGADDLEGRSLGS